MFSFCIFIHFYCYSRHPDRFGVTQARFMKVHLHNKIITFGFFFLSLHVASSSFKASLPPSCNSLHLHLKHPHFSLLLTYPPLSPHSSPFSLSLSLQMGWQRAAACHGQANYLHNYDLPLNHMIPYLGVGN